MTPAQIESAARNRYNAIGDPHYSSDMIMDLIYDACVQMSLEGWIIEEDYTTTSVSGTREYAYPTNAFAIRRVEYSGVKIYPTTVDGDPKTSTTQVSGRPGKYAVWNQSLIMYPTPDTTGDTITVYTYNRPQTVTLTSTLEVPEEYHSSIVDFVLSIMYGKDQNVSMSTYYRNIWERALKKIKSHQLRKQFGDQLPTVRDYEYSNDSGILFI